MKDLHVCLPTHESNLHLYSLGNRICQEVDKPQNKRQIELICNSLWEKERTNERRPTINHGTFQRHKNQTNTNVREHLFAHRHDWITYASS